MEKVINVNEAFDDLPFSFYQVWVCLLCFSVVFFDGFDLTVIGVTIPKIAAHLGATPAEMGLAISAGQLGPMIGAVLIGMLADRFGRKKTMFVCALVFGFFTFMISHISSVEELALYRFLAGLGMGGAIPNALAFGSEFAPSRARASLSLYMWAGMPTGAMIAAFSAAYLLPHYGWQSVYYLGGLIPVVIAFLVLLCVPESLHHLVRTGSKNALSKAHSILSRVDKNLPSIGNVKLTAPSTSKAKGGPIKKLFAGDLKVTTLLIWALFYLSFYLLWILFSWVPTLLKQSGATVQQYSLGFAFIHLGSVIACFCIGRCMSKFNKLNVVKYLFFGAFVAMLAFGYFSSSSFYIVIVVSIFTGMLVNGGNSSLMGLASAVYPSEVRATGIGWAYGIGKIGSLIAPVIGGLYLSRNWSVFKICAINGSSALIIAVIVIILQRHMRASVSGEV
ncbi:MFS transporter [uncultured Desulfuromonas sp.]|uniref:MFS transporter n=1 Tax=uncultured Desulfuromonas sp. TaxID=181013 RepID=UPI002AAAC302|nr:MFS transporter [uncultured Desulfuromonas sp.]